MLYLSICCLRPSFCDSVLGCCVVVAKLANLVVLLGLCEVPRSPPVSSFVKLINLFDLNSPPVCFSGILGCCAVVVVLAHVVALFGLCDVPGPSPFPLCI